MASALEEKEAKVKNLESELKASSETLAKKERELSAGLQEKSQKIAKLESEVKASSETLASKEKKLTELEQKVKTAEELKPLEKEVGSLKKSLKEKEARATKPSLEASSGYCIRGSFCRSLIKTVSPVKKELY